MTHTTHYPFMTADYTSAHTGKDYDECLYMVRYDNSFIGNLWMGGLEGDLRDKEEASLYTLVDAKALALESVNMDPAFDSNGLVIEALTGKVVFDGADYLCLLIDREICYEAYDCEGEDVCGYSECFTYTELMELVETVNSKNV